MTKRRSTDILQYSHGRPGPTVNGRLGHSGGVLSKISDKRNHFQVWSLKMLFLVSFKPKTNNKATTKPQQIDDTHLSSPW
jgi:hypothetical protein